MSIPTKTLRLKELAALRGGDPAKYARGLECEEMAVCGPGEDAATLAVAAAKRALESWGKDPEEIGALIVGTETAKDMSRPLTGWVADGLGLSGRYRSYEVKHACYGGTAAVGAAARAAALARLA